MGTTQKRKTDLAFWLILSLVGPSGTVLGADVGKFTLSACRPKGTHQDFTGRVLEVAAETQGVQCGVIPHVLPATLRIDGRNEVFFDMNGKKNQFGSATLLDHYRVPDGYKGPVQNECSLFEISPDSDIQVNQSERAGIPYPSVLIEGGLLFPLPVLKRKLGVTLTVSLDGTDLISSSCVLDQIRLPRGGWESVATQRDGDTPACNRFIQVLPDDHSWKYTFHDTNGKLTYCAHGILQTH